jgi:hypothetical protein
LPSMALLDEAIAVRQPAERKYGFTDHHGR